MPTNRDTRGRGLTRRQFIRLAAMASAGAAAGWPFIDAVAAEGKNKDDYPVVVIGAGLGGLTAAAYLARHGFPVTLLEQHNVPGGYATSFERAGGKFNFEVSLHATSGGLIEKILAEVGSPRKKLSVELPELAVFETSRGRLVLPQADPKGVIDAFVKAYPDDELGIKGFWGEVLDIVEEASKPFDEDSWWQKLLFPFTHTAMWRVRNQTLGQMLDQYELSPRARAALSGWWGYFGLPPSKLSAFYYAVAIGSMMRWPVSYIKNRSQDLSWALVDALEGNGGNAEMETAAAAIKVKDGRVAGVVTGEGRTIKARAVISNASLPDTLKMLPRSAVPQDYAEKIAGYRPSLSSFIVWLGLNKELRGVIDGHSFFLDADADPEADYKAILECDPHRIGLGVTIYDNVFEGYSKPGTSTVTLIALSGYEPWRRFEADYLAGRKEAYREEKRRVTDILIERAEKALIPGLRSMIEVVESATPLTNLRYTRNPEGAIYGYEQSLDNAYMTRLKNKTPVPGLYLASAWGNPGGGYVGAMLGGQGAFKTLMKDWGFKIEQNRPGKSA